MKFYVRRSKESEIEGPFSIGQINQMVRQKRLNSSSLAIAAKNHDLRENDRTAMRQDWIKLTDVPGYEPDPDGEGKYILLVCVIFISLVLIPVAALIWLFYILKRLH